MPFTDEDLKKFKERVKRCEENIYPAFSFSIKSSKALLARLEAAEVLSTCLSNHEDLDPVEMTEIKNWRKVSGK